MKCNTYYGDHIFYDDMNKAIQTEDITFYNKYLKNNMRALEVACGTGRLSKEIYEHVNEYIGLDYSTDMLEIAKTKNRNVQYIWGDMRNLEKEKLGMFDIIICGFNSLQHLKNDEDIDNFLKSCDNVLRNKGLLIIDIFNPDMRFLNIKEIKEIITTYDGLARTTNIKVVDGTQLVERDDLSDEFKNILSVEATNNSEKNNLFNSGIFTIIKGRHINNNDREKILIHKELAEKNNISFNSVVNQIIEFGLENLSE